MVEQELEKKTVELNPVEQRPAEQKPDEHVCGTARDLQVSMQRVLDNLACAEREAASREVTRAYREKLSRVGQVHGAFLCVAGAGVHDGERPAVLMLFRSLEQRTRDLIGYAQRLKPRSDG